ncbi:MAG: prepilin-type N-terminal cleavage/methylation domain-containing protein [Phycisphaerae bacterium]|nr:prepilin-type N-terminal cleavage/methylation domain-containing protein [Phycisphaerae bacterium]
MNRTISGRARDGFTLIEVAVATAIVGIGITALMACLVAGTRTNRAGQQLAQAVFLVQEIREWSLKLPFSDTDPDDIGNPPGSDGWDPQVWVDDLDDLMNVTYSPPRNACGLAITGLRGWSQTITLTWRNPAQLTAVVTPGTSDMIHVQVKVAYQGRTVRSAGWLVARRSP